MMARKSATRGARPGETLGYAPIMSVVAAARAGEGTGLAGAEVEVELGLERNDGCSRSFPVTP